MTHPSRRWLILVVFYTNLLSLACQVLWVRKLSTLFGSTAAVFSAVLSVFLLGLALGAYAGGRWVDRSAHPWRLLAGCLAGASLWCLASMPLFNLARAAYLAIAPAGLAPTATAFSKLPVVILLILPPTLAIGAVLPVAAALLARRGAEIGRGVAVLYGADTLGAAAGALLAGFVLAPVVGLRVGTLLLGVAGLCLAVWVDRRGPRLDALPAPPRRKERKTHPPRPEPSLEGGQIRAVLAAFTLSGAGAMLLETAWNRFFYVLNGTSVFSLAVVLAGFLAGIGAGSLLAAKRIERVRDLAAAIAVLQASIALAGVLVLRARIPFEKTYLAIYRGSEGFAGFLGGVALLIFGLVFVATLAMGANFPLVARYVSTHADRAGTSLGKVYALNTAGAVAGALLCEFVLLPAWGFGGVMATAALAYCVSAAVFVGLARPERRRRALAASGILGATALALCPPVLRYEPPPNAVYYHGLRDRTWENFSQVNRESTRIYQRQGFYGQVSVLSVGTALFLKHNGKTDATNLPGDNFAQFLMAHLPLMLHPDPRRVVNIGLGGGITLGAVTRYPSIEEIVQVEIDPLVADAAGRHFVEINRRSLEDPRVRMVFDDGRNFIERSAEQYDVIVSEPPNIWVAGVSGLFTRQFYEAAKQRLKPGGLLCQWLPLHELGRDDFVVAIRTLKSVFPHAAVWTNGYDGVVLAADHPLPLAGEQIDERLQLPGMADDMREIGLTVAAAPAFLRRPRFDDSYIASLSGTSIINTDDRPVLEFRSARNLYVYAKSNWTDHWLAGRRGR